VCPDIEIRFHSREANPPVLRVSGRVKPVTDTELRKKCLKERVFLKDMGVDTPDNPLLAIFHLYTGEAFFWTGADTMKEANIPRIKF